MFWCHFTNSALVWRSIWVESDTNREVFMNSIIISIASKVDGADGVLCFWSLISSEHVPSTSFWYGA